MNSFEIPDICRKCKFCRKYDGAFYLHCSWYMKDIKGLDKPDWCKAKRIIVVEKPESQRDVNDHEGRCGDMDRKDKEET